MNEYSSATAIYVAANERQKRSPSRWRTARHEAAHGAMAIACGGEPLLTVLREVALLQQLAERRGVVMA